MLNRIRRAASLTRARYFPKGRHRRPLRLFRPTAARVLPPPADALTVALCRAPDAGNHHHPLAGEENALVRPYMLAWERRARPRAVVIAPHLPTEAWSSGAGVH
ncbi:hypothetical protein GCM10022233_65600 [Streptomyces shaanxiensis]|uniref:Uncharacterized protein n=1 Tax=Streptomyces shaanxiensis TaxID=653357 RepID=A0ABP7VYT8_9ACTN